MRYGRRIDPLKQQLAHLEEAYRADIADLGRRQEQEEQRLAISRCNLQNVTREFSLYSQVTFVAFIRKILYLDRAKSAGTAP